MQGKRAWSIEEDNFLRKVANSIEIKDWVEASARFNQNFGKNGNDGRSAKQCRQRYMNHIQSSQGEPYSNNWDQSDLIKLFQLYKKYGAKWTIICKEFPSKSGNNIKNKFYCILRKFTRKLNNYGQLGVDVCKKQIKYHSITRVLQAYECFSKMPPNLRKWSHDIREKIIEMTQDIAFSRQTSRQSFLWLIQNINQFNLVTRSYKNKGTSENIEIPIISLRKSTQQENDKISAEMFKQIQLMAIEKEKQLKITQNFQKIITNKNQQYITQPKKQNILLDSIFNAYHQKIQDVDLVQHFGEEAFSQKKKLVENEQDLLYEILEQKFPMFKFDDILY